MKIRGTNEKEKKKMFKEMLEAKLQWANNLEFFSSKKLKSALKKRNMLPLFQKKKKM